MFLWSDALRALTGLGVPEGQTVIPSHEEFEPIMQVECYSETDRRVRAVWINSADGKKSLHIDFRKPSRVISYGSKPSTRDHGPIAILELN